MCTTLQKILLAQPNVGQHLNSFPPQERETDGIHESKIRLIMVTETHDDI